MRKKGVHRTNRDITGRTVVHTNPICVLGKPPPSDSGLHQVLLEFFIDHFSVALPDAFVLAHDRVAGFGELRDGASSIAGEIMTGRLLPFCEHELYSVSSLRSKTVIQPLLFNHCSFRVSGMGWEHEEDGRLAERKTPRRHRPQKQQFLRATCRQCVDPGFRCEQFEEVKQLTLGGGGVLEMPRPAAWSKVGLSAETLVGRLERACEGVVQA